jgi:uroporphyrinogen-III synthase
LQAYDLVIFVSANAVEQTFKWITSSALNNVKVATTGKKTADALKQFDVKTDFCPKEIFNSEALLEEPNFKAFYSNKKIAIIRGEGGRDYLRDKLQLADANVDYIDAYQRICPQKDLAILEQHAKQGELDIILLTSGTSVTNFFNLVKNASWVNELTLLLGSPRMEKRIPNSFQGKLVIAEDPSDETLFKTLTEIYK